jgi:hypothetical protein
VSEGNTGKAESATEEPAMESDAEGAPSAGDPLIESALNLSRFHREHEKYYSAAPLEDAVGLQRTSLALTCWESVTGSSPTIGNRRSSSG